MAIGTTAAVLGGAALAGSVGGALIGGSAQKKAAKTAAKAQTDATAQQLQLGRESLGLNRDIYNSNYQTLSPFVGYGLEGAKALNALLGLPEPKPMTSPLAAPAASAALGAASPTAAPATTAPASGTIPQSSPSHPWASVINAAMANKYGGY